MAYKKGGGAAAVAGYGAATRDVTKTEKMWEGIESLWSSAQDIGTAVSLTAGEADTAWGEYEAGYKELGGTDFKRPEWGDKGYFKSRFKGPEGDVRIGDTMYDRSKIQKAGSFLGSDASAILSDEQRQQYLGRTAPGTLATGENLGAYLQEQGEASLQQAGGLDQPAIRRKVPKIIQQRGYQGEYEKIQADKLKESRFQDLQGQIGIKRYESATAETQLDIRKDERAAELAAMREESKTRLSQPLDAPTFSPEFSQKVETGMTAYSEWEARNAQQQENIRINKAEEDELARQFYNQNPKRSTYDTWDQSRNKRPYGKVTVGESYGPLQ